MEHLRYDLGNLKSGSTVVVTLKNLRIRPMFS
jgi:hypothetical protein